MTKTPMSIVLISFFLVVWTFVSQAQADEIPVYGAELEGYAYPVPVLSFSFLSQKQNIHMAYMDFKPRRANGKTAVLLHGKNFCGATWGQTARILQENGYRVIVPDQIGFCKSSKPDGYQYSFRQLATNTKNLLSSLGITKVLLIGHSTGGMLGMRYTLLFPENVEKLVLVNPIGLEDWAAKGVPPITIDAWYKRELATSADKIRAYERNTYYAGEWKEEYEPWVQMLAGLFNGPGHETVAWHSALLYDMIISQPVFYEFEHITVPTVLMIGDKDNTAIGKDLAPPEARRQLGNYPVLAKEAAARMPNARLVEFPNAGHAPQMQEPVLFHKELMRVLVSKGTETSD